MPRKTCPVCRQPWPDGKDPAGGMDNLMQVRMADLLVGLKDNGAVLGMFFQKSVDADTLLQVVDRACLLDDSEKLLTEALRVVELAKREFSECPAVASLPEYLQAHGEPAADGLDGKKIDAGGMRVSWDGESLRFMGTEERAQEDGTWLSRLL